MHELMTKEAYFLINQRCNEYIFKGHIHHLCNIQREFKKYDSKDLHIVRLHIGLEDPKDLILDIKNSLKYIK